MIWLLANLFLHFLLRIRLCLTKLATIWRIRRASVSLCLLLCHMLVIRRCEYFIRHRISLNMVMDISPRRGQICSATVNVVSSHWCLSCLCLFCECIVILTCLTVPHALRMLPLFDACINCVRRRRCRRRVRAGAFAFMDARGTQAQNGGTALISAAAKGHVDCVRLLLNAGADKNVVNKVCLRRGRVDNFLWQSIRCEALCCFHRVLAARHCNFDVCFVVLY